MYGSVAMNEEIDRLQKQVARLEKLYHEERQVSKSYECERVDGQWLWTFCDQFDNETEKILAEAKRELND